MAGRAVRETVTLAGRAERARLARAFVEGVLGPGHPCGDAAALLVGELFSNSLRHSGSGAPGETVAVKMADDVIRVEVTDRSGPGVPEPRPAGSDAEDGRGLSLTALVTATSMSTSSTTRCPAPPHHARGTSGSPITTSATSPTATPATT